MKNIYRINYAVTEDGAKCSVYVYKVLKETNLYCVVGTGNKCLRVSKNDIGVIKNFYDDGVAYKVFVVDLSEKEKYLDEMVCLVRDKAVKEMSRYKKICDNAVPCWCEIIEVEE